MIETTLSMNLMDALDNIQDAAVLWEQWCDEDAKLDRADADGYLRDLVDRVRGGQFCMVIARDGDTPVGMAQIQVRYDSSVSETAAFMDQMYVAMDYRGEGVAHQLACAMKVCTELMGATSALLPCDEKLCGFYEQYGWERYQVLMKRGDEPMTHERLT